MARPRAKKRHALAQGRWAEHSKNTRCTKAMFAMITFTLYVLVASMFPTLTPVRSRRPSGIKMHLPEVHWFSQAKLEPWMRSSATYSTHKGIVRMSISARVVFGFGNYDWLMD